MLSERFELRPGALVVGPDESLGRIDALLAIPRNGQISGFVLSEGPLFNRDVRVPIEAVEWIEDSQVYVWLSAAQLKGLADIQARRYAASKAPPEYRVEARRRVVFDDGEAGSLAAVFVDPTTDLATHLVMGHGDLLGREAVVPMARVRELANNPIVLDMSREQLESLVEYRPDKQITDVVSGLLWYRSNMHPDDLRYVRVRTRDGMVHLSGKTTTEQTRLAIEEHARGVSGVLGVRNDLGTFDALGSAAQALWQPGGSIDQHRSGGPSLEPFYLDGHRRGHDGYAGTEAAAFELGAELVTPLSAVA
jgi:osmotically-inducible protein OsmY